jgi:integrase
MQTKNARILHSYQQHMQGPQGLHEKTIDARLRHILQFEAGLGGKLFRNITKEDINCFKSGLMATDQDRVDNKTKKAAATIVQTCRNLKHFLNWLFEQKNFRSMDRTLSDNCNPTRRQIALSKAKKEKHIPTVEEIKALLASMPTDTINQRRDRAIIAFLILTGVRDGALVSLRLNHVDLEKKQVLQDATVVKTKASKTITAIWFPVDTEFMEIVDEWVLERRAAAKSNEEPLFPRSPSALPGHTRKELFWSTAAPVRKIMKEATKRAGIPYFVPHAVRSTLARLFDQIARTWEERKALSQNLGHEYIRTTEEHYGQLDLGRQRELIEGLRNRPEQSEFEKLSQLFANASADRRETALRVLELR